MIINLQIPALLTALLASTSTNHHYAMAATTLSPTTNPTSAPTTAEPTVSANPSTTSAPSGRMQFDILSAAQLVAELVDSNGDIEIKDVSSSSHIEACGAFFRRGHSLGTLFEKDPLTNQPKKDANGNYIPTDTYLMPEEGIMLSSGSPLDFNWNDKDDMTTKHSAGGDFDLKKSVDASNGFNNAIFDACVLEFKFRCTSDAYVPQLSFSYIWGSEEYYEYVDSAFNDVFGFYLNGVNIARLPSTDTDSDIVSINNVNYKDNAQYFHGNDPGTGWQIEQPDAPDTEIVYPTIEADGFTDVLEARGTPFSDSSQWNKIKLAVGDVGDNILDSWVIIQSSSFSCVDITQSPSESRRPSGAPTLKPTISKRPSLEPSIVPSISSKPTLHASDAPSISSMPTIHHSDLPSISTSPSRAGSLEPSISSMPSLAKSEEPSISTMPTVVPSMEPTISTRPSLNPSLEPTMSAMPTSVPSESPSVSSKPSITGSLEPSVSSMPSLTGSLEPSVSKMPTLKPTDTPSISTEPTMKPTESPSVSSEPTLKPTEGPSISSEPTYKPTDAPSISTEPTVKPTASPSISSEPTYKPTAAPSVSTEPTLKPTDTPSISSAPNAKPSANPSTSAEPSRTGTYPPSTSSAPSTPSPTELPTVRPSISTAPSDSPTMKPSVSSEPTLVPSQEPTISTMPTESPSLTPSISSAPTGVPSIEPSISTSPSDAPSALGSIGPNVVFNDFDEDGDPDLDEPPLVGVEVNLYCVNEDDEWILTGTDVTDEEGLYEFTQLQPALCYISVVPEVNNNTNYVFSPIVPEGNQIYPNGTSPIVEVNYNENVDDLDVGMYLPLSEVGPNVVFNDLDNDGVQDENEGEGPLEGVNVTLMCDGVQVESILTNAEGVYEFDDVLPGDCYVSVIPEVNENDNYVFSPVDPEGNQIYPNGTSPIVTIGYNDTVDDWNVGLHLPLANIGPNTVFNDLDQDGLHDEAEGETAVVFVPITLWCDGSNVATTFSDENGEYEFTDVVPGDCYIQVAHDPDYTISPVTVGGNQITSTGSGTGQSPTVTIGYNETVDTWDVGMFMPPATIGPNEVFEDLDGDGERDPNEPPLPDVTVNLYCYNSDGTAVLTGTNTTDANGEYFFDNVAPGACFIQVTPLTDPNDDGNNDDDYVFSPIVPDGNQIYPNNGTSPVVDIDWNDNIDDWDVGMYIPVTLGNKVWDDLNYNSIQDEGEPGMVNVQVKLVDENGAQVATTLTGEDGSYWFTGLPPGQYAVQFTLPGNYDFTPPGPSWDSGGEGPPPDLTSDIQTLDDNLGVTLSQVLTSGENNTSFDAGLYIPVTVEGVVWDDLNANGVRDVGEPGLTGAGILVRDGDNEYVGYITVTDPDGTYKLNLPPGTYYGEISEPPDYILSPSPPEGTDGSDFDPVTKKTDPVVLQSGDSGAGSFDAGFYEPATITSYVWDDADADGVQGPGEGGYTGLMNVNLYDAADPEGDPILTTFTDQDDGSFNLLNIPPGSYEIEFVLMEIGAAFTIQDAGSDDSIDSDVNPETGRAPITIASGDTITNLSAGVTAMPSLPSTVFEDDNGNGLQDEGEGGLSGVEVLLFDSEGNMVADTTTNPNGQFVFTNLDPDSYYISVNKDPNYPDFEFSPVVPGGNQVSPNGDEPYFNSSPIVTLGLGDDDNSLLVGMYKPVTIGNKVWDDSNGDGVQQVSEDGKGGVTATLRDEGGVSLETTTTDADGHYYFTELAPGGYSVHFSLPERYIFTVEAKGPHAVDPDPTHPDECVAYGCVTSDVDPLTGATDVKYTTSGVDNYSFDAGMFIPVIINGTTWHDLNANGIEEEGEPGLQDATVTLYDRDGEFWDETTTDCDGYWIFDNLPPGTYSAMVTPPSSDPAFELSPMAVNGTDGSDFDPVTWTSAEVLLLSGETGEGLFDAGLYLPATIGDRVWFDETPNGIQDGDELGFDQPVTIKLYDDLGYQVAETESTEDGFYSFQVRPGSYDLEFILPDEDHQFTLPVAGNDTNVDSDASPTTGRASVTVTSGEEKLDIDAGVMDHGPYYPDWTNDVQVCTNDGFDPSWLELQQLNYLYKDKESCCKTHFWWRMTQCMANEEFKFYKEGDICDTKIFFEDWETNSPADWVVNSHFDTLEECCANTFWFDYDGCVERSPVMFKFEFCVDVQGLVDPPDCQSADIFGNVLEDAVNEGCYHHHGLSEVNFNNTSHNERALKLSGTSRALNPDEDIGDITMTDANINKIGGVSLSKVDGSTVCGGSLGGQGFINDLTGTVPDIDAAKSTIVSICGVITVEEKNCTSEVCLEDHYHSIVHELEEFVNDGDLTLAINRRSASRLPPVPELQVVTALPLSLATQNLLLPATITGALDLKYFHGSDLKTCMEKSVFRESEVRYEVLSDCCEVEFQWDIEVCCQEGGGCPNLGIAAVEEVTNDEGDVVKFYPTWTAGELCKSKTKFDSWEEQFPTLDECCRGKFRSEYDNCMASPVP